MSRDRGWDDQAGERRRTDLGPGRHRAVGESNKDALARLAGERDAALHDVARLQADLDALRGVLASHVPHGSTLTLTTIDGDHLTVDDHGPVFEARLRAPMNAQRGLALHRDHAHVLAAWMVNRYLLPALALEKIGRPDGHPDSASSAPARARLWSVEDRCEVRPVQGTGPVEHGDPRVWWPGRVVEVAPSGTLLVVELDGGAGNRMAVQLDGPGEPRIRAAR